MNAETTNAGGWEASQMRAYLNGDGMALLPEDLKKVVAPVDKLTNNVGETQDVSAVTTTSDLLWLFSLVELVGNLDENAFSGNYSFMSDIYDAEGSQYRLFRDMGVRYRDEDGTPILKRTHQGEGCDWYGRSPSPANSSDFLRVSLYGSAGWQTMSGFGTVPGFCI